MLFLLFFVSFFAFSSSFLFSFLRSLQAPVTNTPPDKEYDTHGLPRRDARANAQMAAFFESGVITDTCDNAGCYGEGRWIGA